MAITGGPGVLHFGGGILHIDWKFQRPAGDPPINVNAPRQIPVSAPSISDDEKTAVVSCLDFGRLSSGRYVAEFEEQFAAAHGMKFGVACNSGTNALKLALASACIGPGHRVACPTLTMVACGNAIRYVGATPVFIDSDPRTGNVDAGTLHWLIHAKMVDAVLAVHLYGEPIQDADFFRRFAKSRGVAWIEDCAEAHYAEHDNNGGPVGAGADYACFSFYANKIITTMGEGGMILVDNEKTAERLRRLRAHAFTPGDHFTHSELAYGDRMTDPQAAFGLVQHRRRHEFLRERAARASGYRTRLLTHPKFTLPHRSYWAANWVFPLLAVDQATRDRARRVLADAGVETRTYFKPLHQQAHFRAPHTYDSCPIACDLAARGFYLPLYPSLTLDDVDYICDVLLAI